ncbi:MAG: hypothetical protein QXU46_03470 [Candidatus Bathyarchaeia archaeon]
MSKEMGLISVRTPPSMANRNADLPLLAKSHAIKLRIKPTNPGNVITMREKEIKGCAIKDRNVDPNVTTNVVNAHLKTSHIIVGRFSLRCPIHKINQNMGAIIKYSTTTHGATTHTSAKSENDSVQTKVPATKLNNRSLLPGLGLFEFVSSLLAKSKQIQPKTRKELPVAMRIG